MATLTQQRVSAGNITPLRQQSVQISQLPISFVLWIFEVSHGTAPLDTLHLIQIWGNKDISALIVTVHLGDRALGFASSP